ncbi:hypothetical protein C8P66_12676 [Humitalea rosea]|uniref:Uncharacterized protein n=1 Tax=Humitalea rosea TaxID=990373 RepID=A0A2W7HZB9_9PROT|nr:hypothetical protein [Humitalea rosea]PZW40031.1 hypothetical protein C8P66_12676 [Humitalea rosea]
MRIEQGSDGEARVAAYHPGDLVRLLRDESGNLAMGRAGDWGQVVDLSDGGAFLDIQLAGFCTGYGAAIRKLTDIPRALVCPCDGTGKPLVLSQRGRGATHTRSDPGSGARRWIQAGR